MSKIFRDIPFQSIPGPAITTQGVAVLMSNGFLEKKSGENSNGFAVAPFTRSFMHSMLRW